MADHSNHSKSIPGANQSANMYSYHPDDQNQNQIGQDAIRRSLGSMNPNANNDYQMQNNSFKNDGSVNHNSIIINVDQSPPMYWMFFLIFGIIQIVLIILLANYYVWDNLNHPSSRDTKRNENAKLIIQQKYKLFQDINIMIYLGYGFLRTFLKHHSWSSLAITFIGGILSFEFGLFTLICWSAIFRKDWYQGIFNFQHLLDANYCSAATVISMGALFGKLSFAQYVVMIIAETFFSTLNYVLLKQSLLIIDIGGALSVHLFAAIFGGIFTLVSFSSRQEKERIATSPHLRMNYNSNIFALFGMLILIAYWPSFNTALVEGNQKYRGIINTYLSITGSIVGTFILSPVNNRRKLKIDDILNASFSGGIIIAGCCNIINEFWSSLIFGIIACEVCSLLFNFFQEKLIQLGYHDTAGILFYHGIPGFLGGIVSTIFVGNLKNWKNNLILDNQEIKYFVGELLDYNIFGKDVSDLSFSKRAGIQFAAIFITIAIAAASGFISGFLIKFCNCNIAIRYFNDSEFFDVSDNGDNKPFFWDDEKVQIQVKYNMRS